MARLRRVPALETLHAEHLGDLGGVEAGVEPQGDELAVARLEAGQRGADRGAAQRVGGLLLGRRRVDVGGLGGERGGAPAPAQLVQRGVAGDAEEPCALRSRARARKVRCLRYARSKACAVTSSAAARSRRSVAT